MSRSQQAQTPQQLDCRPGGTLDRLRRDARGFASAEAALLALVLGGICIVAGTILQRAALQAASSLNTELAGGH